MREIIGQLKTLNQLDTQLQMIQKDLDRLPRELSEKQVLSRDLKSSIEHAKSEIIRMRKEADALELDVKSGEDALKRYAVE